MPDRNYADAILDAGKKFADWSTLEIGDEKCAVLPEGRRLQSLKPFHDEYRTRPERRKGTAVLEDLDSLVGFANRFKDKESALFASLVGSPSLTAVIDYHEKGEEVGGAELARFGAHRGTYSFPLSVEWRAWVAQNGKSMGQTDFAEFIENRVADLDVEPKGDSLAFAERTMLAFATPSRMVELSRGLTIRASSNVKSTINLSSGESQFSYEVAHVGGEDHGPLKIPGAFLIAIPVFERGEIFQIAARLRYRAVQGKVTWSYELYKHEHRLQIAFDEACEAAADQTGLPLFRGAPER